LRVISLCPSNSEILFAVGAGDLVVAVENWTDYPPRAARLPKIGTELDIDMDAVAALKPDLVIASLSVPGMERTVNALKDRSIPHMVLDPYSIEDVYDDILLVGEAVGREDDAIELVRSLKERIVDLKEINADRPKPARVYLEWWPKPAIAPGKRSWTNEMIEIAGGRNIFGHIDAVSSQVSYGAVVEHNPEIILLCWCGIHTSEFISSTRACTAGRVLES